MHNTFNTCYNGNEKCIYINPPVPVAFLNYASKNCGFEKGYNQNWHHMANQALPAKQEMALGHAKWILCFALPGYSET